MAHNDTLPCSGCHSPLPLEATGCQICMRARTKQEIMRGYALLREQQARKRRRPYQILAAALFLGASAKLYMAYGDRFMAEAGPRIGAAVRWADDFRNPSNYASQKEPPAPQPPSPPAAPGAPVAPEGALRSQLFPADPEPAPAPEAPAGEAPAPRRAAPRPPLKYGWRVSGTVYDLATLQPVQGADITFLRDDKEPATATTAGDGSYEIDLVKGDGWTVSVEAQGRRPGQVLDIDPPYRVRDADERRAALELISDGDLGPAAVDWERSSSRVRLDLVVVPSRWTDERRR